MGAPRGVDPGGRNRRPGVDPAYALADAAGATTALLMLTHLVAAAIVIPALASRLPR